jgi:hypothetical protein
MLQQYDLQVEKQHYKALSADEPALTHEISLF